MLSHAVNYLRACELFFLMKKKIGSSHQFNAVHLGLMLGHKVHRKGNSCALVKGTLQLQPQWPPLCDSTGVATQLLLEPRENQRIEKMLVGKSGNEASDARGSVDEDAVTSSVPMAPLQLLAVFDASLSSLPPSQTPPPHWWRNAWAIPKCWLPHPSDAERLCWLDIFSR